MKRSKLIYSCVRTVLFSLLFFIGNISYSALPKILIIGDADSHLSDVQQKLISTGMFSSVDMYNVSLTAPDIETLKMYNALLVWTSNSIGENELFGDNLAAYIESGGGVVDAVFDIAGYPIYGDYDSSAYRCIIPGDLVSGEVRTMDSIFLPDHPIMKNVSSFNAGTESWVTNSNSITPGSYIVARYDNDAIFIAAKEDVGSAKVRRVSLNFFPPSSDFYSAYWDASTDGALIMANALAWVANMNNKLPNVLVGGPQYTGIWLVDVRNKLLSTGMFSDVDTINLCFNTPSLDKLQQYKAVLVWGDQDYADSALLGNNLASYIDGGGIVVDAQFALSNSYQIGGRFKEDEYQCLLVDDEESNAIRTLGIIEWPGHAIMNGVYSFNGGSSSYHSTSLNLSSGTYVVARYDNNDILIAAKDSVGPKNVHRVSLNFYPISSDMRADLWDATTDGAKIMANALIWGLSGTSDNNCLNFDGIDNYINTEINPDESLPFTWMVSVLPGESSGEQMMLGTCSDIGQWNGVWFEVDNLFLRFYTDADDFYSSDPVPLNQWSHVAVTYDTLSFKMYINGLLQDEMTKDMTGIDGGNLCIGAIGTGSTNSWLFNGNLDNISIWNRSLTQAEIQQYQSRKLSNLEPGLEAYYDFNQGIAGGNNPNDTILIDRKTSAYNGVLHNFALTGGTSNWIGSIDYMSDFVPDNFPQEQAKNVTFGEPTAGIVKINWTRGNGGKCAVFIKNTSSGTAFPTSGITYEADFNFGEGSQIGSSEWYCIYNGSGTTVTIDGLSEGETYTVHVCEYNGATGSEEYNVNSDAGNPGMISISPISVGNVSALPEIRIYPNPANDYIMVNNSGNMALNYCLFDISGKKVLNGKFTGNTLDISSLKPGMYILDINHTNKFKIIKQ